MKNKKSVKIGALVLLAVVIIGIIVVFVVFNNNTVDLKDLDLNEYHVTSVEMKDDLYVNEPMPSGKLVFKNDEGEEKKVDIKDDGIEISGFDTSSVGSKTMQISILDKQTIDFNYTINYKDVKVGDNYGVINLSIYNPFELDNIFV